jgi:hypothetical protein
VQEALVTAGVTINNFTLDEAYQQFEKALKIKKITVSAGSELYLVGDAQSLASVASGDGTILVGKDDESLVPKVTAPGGFSYVLGSNKPLVFEFAIDYENEFLNLGLVGVDIKDITTLVRANALTEGKEFKSSKGSTIIALQPAYLETLSAGTHTLLIGGDIRGTGANVTFTIAAAPPITPEDVAAAPTTPAASPATADSIAIGVVSLMGIISLVVALGAFMYRRRLADEK